MEKRVKNKKITIDDLAVLIEKSAKETRKYTNKEIDDLALMVDKGFNEMSERFDGVNTRLDALEKGQEDIKADLNKKVDVIIHNELKFRVEKVEEKVGLARKKFKTA